MNLLFLFVIVLDNAILIKINASLEVTQLMKVYNAYKLLLLVPDVV